MKYPSKNWSTFKVQFWTHNNNVPGKPLNDCSGNSYHREIKARTEDEAKRFATIRFGAKRFGKVVKLEPLNQEPKLVPANVEQATPPENHQRKLVPANDIDFGDAVYPATSDRINEGIYMRDYFAAHAPAMPDWFGQKMRQDTTMLTFEIMIHWRWKYADQMLKQRNMKLS